MLSWNVAAILSKLVTVILPRNVPSILSKRFPAVLSVSVCNVISKSVLPRRDISKPKSVIKMLAGGGWFLLPLLLSLVSRAQAECGGGRREVLERVARVQLVGVSLEPLLKGRSDAPLTMDCLNRCQDSPQCRGVMVDYNNMECQALTSSSRVHPSAKYRQAPEQATAYFQKICVKAPTSCPKQWVLERIPGYALEGYDNKEVSAVHSREACAELCLVQTSELLCRSAEYNERTQTCRLSSEDRRTQALSFQPVAQDIHYIENLCAPDVEHGVQCEYESFENQHLASWDEQVTAETKDQCTAACSSWSQFTCRSVTWREEDHECRLSSDDVTGAGGLGALTLQPGVIFLQKSPCLDLDLQCSVDSMTVRLHTDEPFQGRLFSQDAPSSCQQLGSGRTDTHLTINFRERECGVVDEGEGVVSSVVVVQHHPVVQRRGDKAIKLVCLFNTTNRTVSSGYNFQFSGHGLSGGVASAVVNATAPVPRLRLRIVGSDGRDVGGARLGETLTLRLELDDSSVYGIMARNLVARSSDSTGHVTLLDERGCPADPLIFPSLKPLDNGYRGLQGTFQAFKFSEDSVVRFQVNVQFCLQECKPADCEGGTSSYGRRRRSPQGLVKLPPQQDASKFRASIVPVSAEKVKIHLLDKQREAVVESEDDDDHFYHEMPLQKEIIVANTHVFPLRDGRLHDEGEFRRLGNLVCISWEIIICVLVASIMLLICVVLVTVMCVYAQRRRCFPSSDEASSDVAYSERPASSAALCSSEHSDHTLRTLRTSLRD
ncbi:uncharacterized protein LOC108676147 [Hyalella azteca]|uniref:Uncharacterized protein LOC108676147 n=1 Tax=Hyalella azteca TaxID=294128 RepID=A0A8B7P141_HYAAZ|nr:uncharacterized protein LOC108676147 [Hyalella azteca]